MIMAAVDDQLDTRGKEKQNIKEKAKSTEICKPLYVIKK